MKSRFLILLLFLLCSVNKYLKAQTVNINEVGYYKTYEDYLNHNFQKVDSYDCSDFYQIGGKLKVIIDGKKVTLNLKEIWGFRDGVGNLYRIIPGVRIVQVIEIGKITLYYSGYYFYSAPRPSQPGEHESSYLFSTDLNSEVTEFVLYTEKSSKKFLSKYPQYKKLFDCIGTGSEANSKTQSCVRSFNEEEPIRTSDPPR